MHVPSPLNIQEVSILNDSTTNFDIGVSTYKLPANCDVPDRFYPEGKVNYLITNYISCKCCLLEHRALVNHMESIKIPTHVEEPYETLCGYKGWMKKGQFYRKLKHEG